MELQSFLRVLARHRMILFVVPVAAVIITYFLVSRQPDEYVSQSRLATGIVDNTNQPPGSKLMILQNMEADREFENIIQMMLLKKIINQVSYQLIIHDLTNETTFRKESKLLKQLNKPARQHALEVYRAKHAKMEDLSLWNEDEKGLYKVLESMKYDYNTLVKELHIYRVSSSDFITVECQTENPTLSAYIVNTLNNEFITYYTVLVQANHVKAVNYLDSMLKYKQQVMKSTMEDLKNYKIRNRVLNLNEQAKSLYSQLADFETKKEMALKDIDAYNAAIKNIDKKFDPADRRYMESSVSKINQRIEGYKGRLKELNQAYISSNYNPAIKVQIDSVQKKLNTQIDNAADKYAYNPMTAKENLVTQKLSLETSKEMAENSLSVLNQELVTLNRKQDILVPNEAEIQAYEKNIDIVSREYTELLAKYNEASMEVSASVHLRQMDQAMPGVPLPSKKLTLVILSGLISFVFSIVVLFILFLLDGSVNDPKALANRTGLPVLGYLNLLTGKMIDFSSLWSNKLDKNTQGFKELLRSLRFDLENELKTGEKIIAITSLRPAEGKTFLTISLAYAFNHINKKVLIIDGNFNHPSISGTSKTNQTLETVLSQNVSYNASGSKLDIISNKGSDTSLLELADYEKIKEKLHDLKKVYDIILIETAALNSRNVAKEWILFADKTVCVFEAGRGINTAVDEEVDYLKTLNGNFSGWTMNKMIPGVGIRLRRRK